MGASVAREVGPEAVGDGRRERRDRNRDAVVDAMLSLYRDGRLAPSSDEIAERAGLSPRSLFRYFDDIDDLVRSAIDRHLERVRPTWLLKIDPSDSVEQRIRSLVAQRLKMFDAMSFVGVISRIRAPFQPIVAEQLTEIRAFLRNQLRELLAPELERLDAPAAANVLSAVDVLCSFEGYQLLRLDQGFGRARAGAVMTDALTRLLS
ncbi:MAG: TetR/AcrR family transcriptional regulator [Ilumatobacteraceae bacterium]